MKILINICVWNRKKLTELVISSINKYKQDATLWVYNDWSEEYDNAWLEQFCDRAIKLPASDKKVVRNEANQNGMGVQYLRWHQLREFNKQDEFDFLYLTDSDAIHDPNYIYILKTLYSKYKANAKNQTGNSVRIDLPICLYNSVFHRREEDKLINNEVISRQTAPGISHLYSKEMVAKIVNGLDNRKEEPDYGWDYYTQMDLQIPFITTNTSYVEHFGADEESLHTPKGFWDRDRAINPSDYLQRIRPLVIDYIEGRSSKPIL